MCERGKHEELRRCKWKSFWFIPPDPFWGLWIRASAASVCVINLAWCVGITLWASEARWTEAVLNLTGCVWMSDSQWGIIALTLLQYYAAVAQEKQHYTIPHSSTKMQTVCERCWATLGEQWTLNRKILCVCCLIPQWLGKCCEPNVISVFIRFSTNVYLVQFFWHRLTAATHFLHHNSQLV